MFNSLQIQFHSTAVMGGCRIIVVPGHVIIGCFLWMWSNYCLILNIDCTVQAMIAKKTKQRKGME